MNELFAICRTFEIDDGQARGFVLMRVEESGEAKPWPILITRKANQFFGFENACPLAFGYEAWRVSGRRR